MKRILPVLSFLVFLTAFPHLEAENVRLDPLFVFSPRIMAQGGSFTAVASGHESLYTNPAGFASSKGSLSLLSLTGWSFMNPGIEADDSDGSADSYGWMKAQTVNGFGGGASLGISYVGRGIGIGFIASSNLLLQGDTFPLGLEGSFSTTFALIGGYAHTFNIKSTRLIVGGDLRPMIRGYAPLGATTVNNFMDAFFDENGNSRDDVSDADVYAALNGRDEFNNPTAFAYQGAGLGIDLGAKWEIGPFTVGLSIKDLFNTRITMYAHPLGDYAEQFITNASLPSNSDAEESEDDYYIPMTINLGAAYHPDVGKWKNLIDPTVHLDLVDPIGVAREGQSPWALLHLGTDLRVLRIMSLRAGLNQGYATAGMGMKLFFLDFGASIFTRELGPYAGDQPNTGISFEVSLRF